MECVKSVKIRVTKFVCFAALKILLEVANKFNCGVHELLPPINNKWSKYVFDAAFECPKNEPIAYFLWLWQAYESYKFL